MSKQNYPPSSRYKRKLNWVNKSFRGVMLGLEQDPVTAVKQVRRIVRSVLTAFIKSDHSYPPSDFRALWATAKAKLPQPLQDNASKSLPNGLAWIEQGMLMELGNLGPDGRDWSSVNGVDFRPNRDEARVTALIAHIACIYFLEVAKDNEEMECQNRGSEFTEKDIPF